MSKTSKRSQATKTTPEEEQLLAQLRRHPELREQVQCLLDLAEGADCTADEFEDQLVPEVRKLGRTTVESWGRRVEQEAGDQYKADQPGAQQSKKKR
jgi:hypothetical protein